MPQRISDIHANLTLVKRSPIDANTTKLTFYIDTIIYKGE